MKRYGSRAGFWRLHRLLTEKEIPTTVYAVGMALERSPEACQAMMDSKWEIASHGYRCGELLFGFMLCIVQVKDRRERETYEEDRHRA